MMLQIMWFVKEKCAAMFQRDQNNISQTYTEGVNGAKYESENHKNLRIGPFELGSTKHIANTL